MFSYRLAAYLILAVGLWIIDGFPRRTIHPILRSINSLLFEKKVIKKYFTDFSFKHPTPNDVKRSMEKVSGIHLDWYLNEWTQTLHTIDYGIKSVEGNEITLERKKNILFAIINFP